MPALLRSITCLAITAFALSSCHKAPPKKKRQEIVADAVRDRRMTDNFVNSLRKVMEWRQTQPIADTEESRRTLIKSVVKRLDEVPASNLPADLGSAWARMLKCWHALDARPESAEGALKAEGAAASAELNRLLKAAGYPDVQI